MNRNDARAFRQSMGIGCLIATIILVSSMWALRRFFGGYMICTFALAVIIWLGVTWLVFVLRRA